MRIKEINGIVNDLLNLRDWENPLQRFWINNKCEFDLLSGEIDYVGEEDSLTELCSKKREWFIDRVKKLNGNLNDFDKALISVFGKKEKIEIVYKGRKFEKEFVWGEDSGVSLKRIRDKIKSLKSGEGFGISNGEIVGL